MFKLKSIGLALLLAVFIVPIAAGAYHFFTRIHIFADIAGPNDVTVIPPPRPADWKRYELHGDSRLAILLTDDSAPWLPLVQGLKSRGVAFTLTKDASEAVRHKAILIYPMVSGRVLSGPDLQALAAHPRKGGTLMAANVLGGLQEVFGFKEAVPSRARFEITIGDDARQHFGFSEPEEKVIRLGNRQTSETAQIGTNGYAGASDPIAAFEDGTAAITRRRVGDGAAYAFGFDPGSLLLAGQAARGQDLERDYVNAYAPQNDVLVQIIAQLWREAEPLAASLSPVPDGRQLAIMITHDIDYTKSLANAVTYAEEERARGVSGTFFIQTKYLRDYNDEIILDDEAKGRLQRLRELGMELASHTVSHSRVFRNFEMGTGKERYPDYRPLAQDRDAATGGTILGELRVSKFLIEELGKPAKVVSFRPGHLSYPFSLPQALEATGFHNSSSVTAGNALSHLPFQLGYERGASAMTNVFEFPVTIEDEKSPFLGMRIDQSLDVARKIARRGGIYVLLVHPNILGHKLDFVRALIDRSKDKAWFGTLETYGNWWSARDKVLVDTEIQNGKIALKLDAPEKIAGLSIEIPRNWQLASASDAMTIKRTPEGILLSELQGKREILFDLPRQASLQ